MFENAATDLADKFGADSYPAREARLLAQLMDESVSVTDQDLRATLTLWQQSQASNAIGETGATSRLQ